jgi:hypothetical protein
VEEEYLTEVGLEEEDLVEQEEIPQTLVLVLVDLHSHHMCGKKIDEKDSSL